MTNEKQGAHRRRIMLQQLTFIALLRGINVGTSKRISMADLRAVCTGLGWSDVQTYINSGNVIFRAAGDPAALGSDLELAMEQPLGMTVPVIVRSASQWTEYVRNNPFPDASACEPKLVMLALSRSPPHENAVERLRERATVEQIERSSDALWIHFAGGSGRSKLTPALLDRSAGSPVTTRNWRTVLKLEELVSSRAAGGG